VLPTKAPSIQTCAAVGTDRSKTLPAFGPARSSRFFRLTTSGAGPDGNAKCGDLFLLSGRAVLDGPSCLAPVALEAETELPPAASTVACALALLQVTDRNRQERTVSEQEQRT
jgi:hypothetical protein